MGETWGEWFGRHFVAPFTMIVRARFLSVLLFIIWLSYPFALQTVFHPSDAIGFQQWMQGLPVSEYITRQAQMFGLASALLALAFLCVVHFLVLLLIYRQVQIAVSLWLVATLLVSQDGAFRLARRVGGAVAGRVHHYYDRQRDRTGGPLLSDTERHCLIFGLNGAGKSTRPPSAA